jgi:hypothetical protein
MTEGHGQLRVIGIAEHVRVRFMREWALDDDEVAV